MCFYIIISNISAFESFKVAQYNSIVSVSRKPYFLAHFFLRKKKNESKWFFVIINIMPQLPSFEPLEYSCKDHHIKSTEQIRN